MDRHLLLTEHHLGLVSWHLFPRSQWGPERTISSAFRWNSAARSTRKYGPQNRDCTSFLGTAGHRFPHALEPTLETKNMTPEGRPKRSMLNLSRRNSRGSAGAGGQVRTARGGVSKGCSLRGGPITGARRWQRERRYAAISPAWRGIAALVCSWSASRCKPYPFVLGNHGSTYY